ncbi:hypothetical protein [Streptomyces sp. NBC_00207]|uniref:hypothetical protein n=1 Tax=unclassified Streptomyces TaxID=2593676 RepID=UPI002887BD83|nr:hypothetical protein [Streptomyces sp. DSM 41633]
MTAIPFEQKSLPLRTWLSAAATVLRIYRARTPEVVPAAWAPEEIHTATPGQDELIVRAALIARGVAPGGRP